jgi:1-acyl-sn-glycerol-3-phosphate acyltransferase
VERLAAGLGQDGWAVLSAGTREAAEALPGADVAVYLPTLGGGQSAPSPAATDASRVLGAAVRAGVRHLVVISSAEIYGPSAHNPGHIAETRPLRRDEDNAVSLALRGLESAARGIVEQAPGVTLTVLRPSPVPVRGRSDYYSRLLSGPIAVTLAGFNPSLQLLDPKDLARAVSLAARGRGGVFNVAPRGVIPLRAALDAGRTRRVPVPRELQLAARQALSPLGMLESTDQLDFLRYSFTISGEKIATELGFVPSTSSAAALAEFHGDALGTEGGSALSHAEFDDFGMDKSFIAFGSRTLFDFLARRYWRVEVEGLEHVPREGRGVLAGIHRGLVAWDGVMVLHTLAQQLARYPRFLVHPTGFRFPFVFDVTTKLGGVLACQENADYVLEHDELLGIFPEGIRGTFQLYREAYQLRKFGRHDFVKIALRHGAPIIPFVVLGSAETYPILGKVDWGWWKRKTEWPFFPITPQMFPFFPLPLPSKWRIKFLPRIDVSEHPPEAAKSSALVRSISNDVRAQMEHTLAELSSQRRSIFLG